MTAGNTARRAIAAALTAALMAGGLAACGGAGGGSGAYSTPTPIARTKSYASVREMADDSDAIIIGTVQSQDSETGEDGKAVTLSTLSVDESAKGEGLGDTLVVRQYGDKDMAYDTSLLVKGYPYLLFLTRTGPDGESADGEYFIAGSNAGIYIHPTSTFDADEDATTTAFTHVSPDPDDGLPIVLSLEQALGED